MPVAIQIQSFERNIELSGRQLLVALYSQNIEWGFELAEKWGPAALQIQSIDQNVELSVEQMPVAKDIQIVE